MQDARAGRERPEGQTSGTDRRLPHELREPVTALNLLDEAAALRREPSWEQSDRNAKTFVKATDLRLVLTILKQGAIVKEHRAPGSAVVQTLNLGAQGAGLHSFDWPAGAATSTSGLTFRVGAATGGVATAVTPLMRDRVDAISTSGTSFNLELESSGTVPYGAVKAFN